MSNKEQDPTEFAAKLFYITVFGVVVFSALAYFFASGMA